MGNAEGKGQLLVKGITYNKSDYRFEKITASRIQQEGENKMGLQRRR